MKRESISASITFAAKLRPVRSSNRIMSCFDLWSGNQLPRLFQMQRELFVAYSIDLYADPSSHTYIWRPVELLRRFPDEHLLNPDCCRHGDRDVTIIVMIVREHREDFLADEPGGFTMRSFLPRLGQGQADSPHTFNLFFAVVGCFLFRQVELLFELPIG